MREKIKEESRVVHVLGSLALLLAGMAMGANLFPRTEQVTVERIVERRVEVPVEVVKYLDRVVEKRVEVPVEKVVYVRDTLKKPQDKQPDASSWLQVTEGLSRSDVLAILGEPRKIEGGGSFEDWYYEGRGGARVSFLNGKVYAWVAP